MFDQNSIDSESISNTQQRAWTRFPPDEPQMRVLVAGQTVTVRVVDESFAGIGVLLEMPGTAKVDVGDSVTVLQKDVPAPGIVQWVRQDPETDRLRLGIRWSS